MAEDELPLNKVGILSGPSHAEEVARNLPTTIVLCSKHDELIEDLQDSTTDREIDSMLGVLFSVLVFANQVTEVADVRTSRYCKIYAWRYVENQKVICSIFSIIP